MFDTPTMEAAGIYEQLKELLPGSVVKQNEPLARRTTLRVGGPADTYIEPSTEAELGRAAAWCSERGVPFRVIGRGSNLLIRDGGIRGVVACLAGGEFCAVEARGAELHCGAGAKLKAVAAKAREHSLSGLEFLEGIPGSVGGALRMNAGAMGGETFEALVRARFMDMEGHVAERMAAEIPASYRSCPFFKNRIALAAVFRGQTATREAITRRTAAFNEKRWQSQPKEPSAGCIFKNPSIGAGQLIDELGMKGARVGGAVVSEIHANFIVNEGNATATDVLDLIALIQERARAVRGVDLVPEVEIVGEDP